MLNKAYFCHATYATGIMIPGRLSPATGRVQRMATLARVKRALLAQLVDAKEKNQGQDCVLLRKELDSARKTCRYVERTPNVGDAG